MPTAPHISIYEIFPDKPSEELETIFSPDTLYALATAMSYVENNLRAQDAPEIKGIIQWYNELTANAPDSTHNIFNWYVETSQELAEVTDDESWKTSPERFKKTVRAFLVYAFMSDLTVTKKKVAGSLIIFKIYKQLIEHEIGETKLDEPFINKLLRIVLFPVRPILRPIVMKWAPLWVEDFDDEIGKTALDRIQRICHFYRLCAKEDRTFTFSQPKDQVEKEIDVDGVKITSLRGGKMSLS
ncbi:hypothetical protein JXA32_07340 [Candidatus Sumerlaeota bacterium]|nr:hypothetical protein [Candidatus Sumerlaeota bacterium]